MTEKAFVNGQNVCIPTYLSTYSTHSPLQIPSENAGGMRFTLEASIKIGRILYQYRLPKGIIWPSGLIHCYMLRNELAKENIYSVQG